MNWQDKKDLVDEMGQRNKKEWVGMHKKNILDAMDMVGGCDLSNTIGID
ncbi:hypothetical protein M1146_04085 [Patescibacteria group bacterium]|nr:hypothetical protein [Patescibacteria group bacterium]